MSKSSKSRSKANRSIAGGRDRRAELLRRLDVTDAALRSNPTITYHMRLAKIDTERIVDILRADDQPESHEFVDCYDSLTPRDQRMAGPDVIALAAGLTPRRVWELFSGAALVQSREAVSVMIALNLPEIMQVTIEKAKEDGMTGHIAREHIYKTAGVLPTPRSSTTTINVGQPAQIEASDDDDELLLPDANEFYKGIHAGGSQPKELPSPQPTILPPIPSA